MKVFKSSLKVRSACLGVLLLFLLQSVGPLPSAVEAAPEPGVRSAQIPAIPDLLKDFPRELGSVEEFQEPFGSVKAPFILHVQDVHASPQVQEKIRDILKWVQTSSFPHDFRRESSSADPRQNHSGMTNLIVGLEGASGELHPEYLNFFPDSPQSNETIVRDLFHKGELTGAELLAWEKYQKNSFGNDAVFFGVEDPALYREDFAAYREVLFAQDSIRQGLASIQKELDLAKSRIFSPALNEFYRERSWRKEGNYGTSSTAVQLLPYMKYLARKAAEVLQVDLNERIEQLRFPSAVRILALERLEKENNPEKAEEQRLVLEILHSEIDMNGLSGEMKKIEEALLSRWAVTEEQKKLVQRLHDFELLEKLLTLKLTREEYQGMSFRWAKWIRHFDDGQRPEEKSRFLKSEISHPLRGFEMTEALTKRVNHALHFYQSAQKRDRALLENLLQKAEGARMAVLVTGGFHTDGLTSLLKERGIGYAVLRPKVQSLGDPSLLTKVFLDENAVLPTEFQKFSFTKQEALFLKGMIAAGPDAGQIAQSVNQHPLLSRKISVTFPSTQDLPADGMIPSSNAKAGTRSGVLPSTQGIVYELLMQSRYAEIWQPPAQAGVFKDTVFSSRLARLGLQFDLTRSESRTVAVTTENSFDPAGLQELEAYSQIFLAELKPEPVLTRLIRESKEKKEVLQPLADYFSMIETGNKADKILQTYLKAREGGDLEKANLIEEMIDAYLFKAPELSNRYRSALYVKEKILQDELERQNRAEDILQQYIRFAVSPQQAVRRMAFLLEGLLAQIKSRSGNGLAAGAGWVLSKMAIFNATRLDQEIPSSNSGNHLNHRVSVVGLGGDSSLPTAALLAKNGFEVFAMDSAQVMFEIREELEKSDFEPAIQRLVKDAQDSSNLKFFNFRQDSLEAAIRLSRVIYLDASKPLELGPEAYEKELTVLAQKSGKILSALRQEGDHEFRIFVFRGTFPEGTMRHLYDLFKKENPNDENFEIAYQLDFARRGRAVQDEMDHQVVIGLSSAPTGGIEFSDLSQTPAWQYLGPVVGSLVGPKGLEERLQINSLEGAELAKIAILVNMAAKHNLRNEFAPVVTKNFGSLRDVSLIAGMDHRIGSSFMRPTVALGGRLMQQIRFLYESYRLKLKKTGYNVIPAPGNLAAINEELRRVLKKPHLQDARLKDPQYLMALFLTGIIADNEESLVWFEEQILKEGLARTLSRGKKVRDARVALLGVAYKDGTDQITESASLRLFEWLVEKNGVKKFTVYDPLALNNFQNWLTAKKREMPLQYESVEEPHYEPYDPLRALEGADFAIIGAPLAALSKTAPADLKNHLKNALLVDAVNLYAIPGGDKSGLYTVRDVENSGLNYLAFGSPALGPAFNPFNSNFHHKGEFIPAKQKAGSEQWSPMEVAFFGGGYVGFVSGAVLADAGHHVTVIDVLKKNVALWRSGQTTIKEEGLDELLKKGLETGRLRFALGSPKLAQNKNEAKVTKQVRAAVLKSRFLYMAVNTPEGEDGQADLKYIRTVTLQIGKVLSELNVELRRGAPKIIAVKSTVPGTVFSEISRILKAEYGLEEGLDFWLVSNPEILVEGEAVKGAQKPSRTILGIRSPRNSQVAREAETQVKNLLIDLWAPVRERHPHPIIITDEISSPNGKYASNALLALPVSLANRFAALAQSAGVDYRREIETVLRRDPRFTPFLHCSPGPGYGGHCFPKDNREIINSTRIAFGSTLRHVYLVDQTDLANEITKRQVAYEAARVLVGDEAEGASSLRHSTLGIVGLTFKEGTDDVRESPSVITAIELALKGATVHLFDANFQKSDDLKSRIQKNFKDEFARIFIHDFFEYEPLERKFEIEPSRKKNESIEEYANRIRAVMAAIIAEYFEGELPRILFDETPDFILDKADEIILLGTKKEYRNLEIGRLKDRTIDGTRKPPLIDTRGVFTARELEAAGVYSPGVGRPDLGEPVADFFARSEVRKLQVSTGAVVAALERILKERPLLPDLSIYSPAQGMILSATAGIYGNVNEFTLPLIVRDILPSRASAGGFTPAEKTALSLPVIERFFTPAANAGDVKKRTVLAENMEALPLIDRHMKLWIQHLAARPGLVWGVYANRVSREEANAFLVKLTAQARQWGYSLQPGQILIYSTSAGGFDAGQFQRGVHRGISHAALAENEKAFKNFPITGSTEFLATVSGEISKKTAQRLLAAEVLRNGYNGIHYQIIPADHLASRSEFRVLMAAIQAYTKLASAA